MKLISSDFLVHATGIKSVGGISKATGPQHWTLAFQGNVHVLSDKDNDLIEQAVRKK